METATKTTTWSIDPTHSEVQFKVKHLVISTVSGQFSRFKGTLESDGENFENARVSFEAETDSISTNNADRDNHLRSADFFDAAQFPTLNFKSTEFTKTGDSSYDIHGKFTMKGVTKEITLKAEFGGVTTDPYGNVKAGFEILGRINRKDFGLNWSAMTESGGLVVSDEVRLILNIQFVRQA